MSSSEKDQSEKYKIDLTKPIKKASPYSSLSVGAFDIKSVMTQTGLALQIIENDKVLVEIYNYDVFIQGISIKGISQVLENHYTALKQLIEK